MLLKLRQQFNIEESCNFVLIGDGSGSTFERACGWSSILINFETREFSLWWGAMSRGTVNIGEIMAYVQPLTYLTNVEISRREANGGKHQFVNITILTDSQYVKEQGSSRGSSVKKNGAFWRLFDGFAHQGILLKWQWLARDTHELNSLVDGVSKAARKAVTEFDLNLPQKFMNENSDSQD